MLCKLVAILSKIVQFARPCKSKGMPLDSNSLPSNHNKIACRGANFSTLPMPLIFWIQWCILYTNSTGNITLTIQLRTDSCLRAQALAQWAKLECTSPLSFYLHLHIKPSNHLYNIHFHTSAPKFIELQLSSHSSLASNSLTFSFTSSNGGSSSWSHLTHDHHEHNLYCKDPNTQLV